MNYTQLIIINIPMQCYEKAPTFGVKNFNTPREMTDPGYNILKAFFVCKEPNYQI